jgi:hypothetical protein
MLNRRGFFGTILPVLPTWRDGPDEGQRTAFASAIGGAVFCRASSGDWLRRAREIAGSRVIGEVEAYCGSDGAVIVGTRATLVIKAKEWTVLP